MTFDTVFIKASNIFYIFYCNLLRAFEIKDYIVVGLKVKSKVSKTFINYLLDIFEGCVSGFKKIAC